MRKHIQLILVIIGILVITTLLAAHCFLGSDAEINLTAPKSYQVGDLVVLDATDSVAARLNWTILPKTKNFKIVGKTAYFSSSAPDRYTVIVTATNNGTLATKVFFLEPGTNDPGTNDPEIIEPLVINPKVQKLLLLINGGSITSLDDAILVAKQFDLILPDFKTFEELEHWLH